VQSAIISLLIDVNHGRLNTNILKTNQLQNEIKKNQASLSETLVLPGKRTGTELKEVYTLSTANGIFIENKLIINAKIPLFNRHPSKLLLPRCPECKTDVTLAQLRASDAVRCFFLCRCAYLTSCVALPDDVLKL